MHAWRFPARAEAVVENFTGTTSPSSDDYRALLAYFVEGFLTYRVEGWAGADFPGWPSSYGTAADRLEGFSRSVPVMAAWLNGGRTWELELQSGARVDIGQLIREGVVAGTDPDSAGYWGPIGHKDPRIVEAADVALSLWLARESVWKQFSTAEKAQVAAWLGGVNGKQTADNNWHLFVVLVNLVLRDLGAPHDLAEAKRRYDRARSFYRGDGWFSDGPDGRFDYYNAWGFHYTLFWIDQVDPSFDHDFIRTSLDTFAFQLKHMIGPHGLPIMGRSVCYRLGAAAPVVMAAGAGSIRVTPGEARRALDVTWGFFAGHGAIRHGMISQGYCGDDPRVLDSYSGPASCLWSLRSLVAAFYLPDSHAFWTGPARPLPVELHDFELPLPVPGWHVVGNHETLDVTLHGRASSPAAEAELLPYTFPNRIKTFLTGRPYRPGNLAAKYEQSSYGSRDPFCGCAE